MRPTLLLALSLGLAATGHPVAVSQEPPAKKGENKELVLSAKRLEEGYGKIKSGMTADQLADLLGPITAIKIPGDPTIANCEQELRWVDRTSVKVTFKAGKVTDVFAEVSPTLVFERVTRANVLKLKPGMTEQEVVDLLGAGYWSRDLKDDAKMLGWTPVVTVTVQLYKGKSGAARSMTSSSFSLE